MTSRPLSSDSESFVQALRNRSISASPVAWPVETRIAPRASAGSTPIAASTDDGCTLPEEQAAPDDTATPARSKAITAVSARSPEWLKDVVFGNRSAFSPKMMTSGVAARRPGFDPLAQPQGVGLFGSDMAGNVQPPPRRNRQSRRHFRFRRADRVPGRRRRSAGRTDADRPAGSARQSPSDHRSCAQTSSEDRRSNH